MGLIDWLCTNCYNVFRSHRGFCVKCMKPIIAVNKNLPVK